MSLRIYPRDNTTEGKEGTLPSLRLDPPQTQVVIDGDSGDPKGCRRRVRRMYRLNLMQFHLTILIAYLFVWTRVMSTAAATSAAEFPLQLTADVKVIANMIEEGNDYPPRERKMRIYYDYIKKRARADIDAGYEVEKTYIRRYDQENEYMIRYNTINDCKRSYLGETMPFPQIPETAEYIDSEVINGINCNYFIYTEEDTSIHMYFSKLDGSPVKLIQESIENGVSTHLLTFEYSNTKIGSIDEEIFVLPPDYTHSSCERHLGGFPYLHVFHYFVRF